MMAMKWSRRSFIRASTLLGGAFAMAACAPEAPKFHAVDITGAGYGASLQALRDPGGRAYSLADFDGKVLAVFFGFTQCPDVCPTTLAKLKDIKTRLGPDSERLAVAFVSVDPERDTPIILKAYAAAFDPAFVPLLGDPAITRTVTQDFKIFYERVGDVASGRYTVNHTTGIYLFDPRGRVRLFVRHEDTPEQILSDIRTLLEQSS